MLLLLLLLLVGVAITGNTENNEIVGLGDTANQEEEEEKSGEADPFITLIHKMW